VHRIGRTGRSGKKGLATTFINKGNEESVLLDLKHLLIEAKQKLPYFLATLMSENEKYLDLGGTYIAFVVFYVGEFSWSFGLLYACNVLFQTKRAAVTVVVWDTESQTVPNWKHYKRNKLQASERGIIWRTILQIIKYIFLSIFFVIFEPDHDSVIHRQKTCSLIVIDESRITEYTP
jgi:hypothetical protein